MATKRMHLLSADDVLQLPLPPGVSGYELVDGHAVEVMSSGELHSHLTGEVFARLRSFVKDRPERPKHLQQRIQDYLDAGRRV
ncbi:MAG: hypothetical protein ACT4O1_00200 [Gemmatimonadota bacterium]